MFSSVTVIQTSFKKIYSGIHKNGIVSAMSFVTIDSFKECNLFSIFMSFMSTLYSIK